MTTRKVPMRQGKVTPRAREAQAPARANEKEFTPEQFAVIEAVINAYKDASVQIVRENAGELEKAVDTAFSLLAQPLEELGLNAQRLRQPYTPVPNAYEKLASTFYLTTVPLIGSFVSSILAHCSGFHSEMAGVELVRRADELSHLPPDNAAKQLLKEQGLFASLFYGKTSPGSYLPLKSSSLLGGLRGVNNFTDYIFMGTLGSATEKFTGSSNLPYFLTEKTEATPKAGELRIVLQRDSLTTRTEGAAPGTNI